MGCLPKCGRGYGEQLNSRQGALKECLKAKLFSTEVTIVCLPSSRKGPKVRERRESKPTRWERNEQACPSLLSREIVTLQFLWFSFCCRIRNKSLTKATRGRNSYSSSQLQVPGHQTEEDTAHLKAKRNQCIHAACFVLPMSR